MASHLDLEEQEQLDQLKAFWDAYGNLITAVLVIVVGGYLAWLGWNAYQRDQGAKAGAMYDELDRAAQAGDATRAGSIFGDMKERYPRAAFTAQGGMLAAKTAFDKGQLDAARGDLAWVADSGSEGAYRAAARLRLAGLLLDAKKYDEALKQLDAIDEPEFAALAADRRGDVLAAWARSTRPRRPTRRHSPRWTRRSTTAGSSKPSSTCSAWRRRPPRPAAPEHRNDRRDRRHRARRLPRRLRSRIRRRRRAIAVLALLGVIAGCSLFAPDKPKPKALEPIVAPITARQLWNQNIGSVQFPLQSPPPATSPRRIERRHGRAARSRERQDDLARQRRRKLAAGVGSDGKVAAVVTRDGDLVAIEAGQVKLAQAARRARRHRAAGRRRAHLRARRRSRACRPSMPSDGAQALAAAARPAMPLTLAQTGRDRGVQGHARRRPGPAHVGRRSGRRCVRWEVPLGSPRGANEVERLADLIGPAAAHRRPGLRALVPGRRRLRRRRARRIAWTKTVGGTDAVAGDAELIVRRRCVRSPHRLASTPTGDVAWTSEALLYRGLGAPARRRQLGCVRRRERHAALALARQGRGAAAPADRRQRDRRAAGRRRLVTCWWS